jgi:hypothetical protein
MRPSGPTAVVWHATIQGIRNAVVVIRDSGRDPEKAKQVIRRVVNDDRIDPIVGAISLISQETKPYATAARVHVAVGRVEGILGDQYWRSKTMYADRLTQAM